MTEVGQVGQETDIFTKSDKKMTEKDNTLLTILLAILKRLLSQKEQEKSK